MMAARDQHWYEPILNERGALVTRLRTRLRNLRAHAPGLRAVADALASGQEFDREVAARLLSSVIVDIDREHE